MTVGGAVRDAADRSGIHKGSEWRLSRSACACRSMSTRTYARRLSRPAFPSVNSFRTLSRESRAGRARTYADHVPIDYDPNQEWPPAALVDELADLTEYGAWYRGDPEELWRWYARQPNSVYPQVRPSQLRGGMVGWVARAFWGRPSNSAANPGHMHVPAPSDLSALSSDLLFSENPAVEVETADGDGVSPTEKYLQAALTEQGGYALWSEAAEKASAYGSVFLRAIVDTQLADAPFMDTVPAAMAVPEWRFGRLVAVTFWRDLASVGSDTVLWRHLERHECVDRIGRNYHALFK